MSSAWIDRSFQTGTAEAPLAVPLRGHAGCARVAVLICPRDLIVGTASGAYAATSLRPSCFSIAPLGWAPIAAAAGSPSLKRTIVGIDAIP